VVELWKVERPCPLLAAPGENLDFGRVPLVEAVESAFLHENGAREILQPVGEHPGTAVGTENAIEPFTRTRLGIRSVGEALCLSAEHCEIRVRHRRERRYLSAGRPLAIRAVTVGDEGRGCIEPVRHLTTGTVTGVLLAHDYFFPWKLQSCRTLHAAFGSAPYSSNLSNIFTPRSAALRPLAGLVPVTTRPEVIE